MIIEFKCPHCKKTEKYKIKNADDYVICWNCLKAYRINGEYKSQAVLMN